MHQWHHFPMDQSVTSVWVHLILNCMDKFDVLITAKNYKIWTACVSGGSLALGGVLTHTHSKLKNLRTEYFTKWACVKKRNTRHMSLNEPEKIKGSEIKSVKDVHDIQVAVLSPLLQAALVEEVGERVQESHEPRVSFDRHVYFTNFSRHGFKMPLYLNLVRDPVEKLTSRWGREVWCLLFLPLYSSFSSTHNIALIFAPLFSCFPCITIQRNNPHPQLLPFLFCVSNPMLHHSTSLTNFFPFLFSSCTSHTFHFQSLYAAIVPSHCHITTSHENFFLNSLLFLLLPSTSQIITPIFHILSP